MACDLENSVTTYLYTLLNKMSEILCSEILRGSKCSDFDYCFLPVFLGEQRLS